MQRGRRSFLARVVGIAFVATCIVAAPKATSQTVTGLPQSTISIPVEPGGREFTVRLTPPVALNTCFVQAYLTGAFGGSAGPPGYKDLGGGAFSFRTGVRGKPAETLKVFVWCRERAMAFLDVPSLQSSTFEAAISLQPLPGLALTGRVLPLSDGTSMAGATLRVSYEAVWLCGFYGGADCVVPAWDVAVDRIGADGTFRVTVPDITRDPVVSAHSGRAPYDSGFFFLSAERATAPSDFVLTPEGSTRDTVRVAGSYPELVLRPTRH